MLGPNRKKEKRTWLCPGCAYETKAAPCIVQLHPPFDAPPAEVHHS